MSDPTHNMLYLIEFLWEKKKSIIISAVIAGVISTIVSLAIQEKFESSVTLYPAKSSSVTFNEVITEDQSVSKFGEEEEAEQMLQILESGNIRSKIIMKYNLLDHYEIDVTGKYVNTDLNETYSENISFKRNNNGAVIITVMDKSPDTAALIANNIALLYDSTKNAMIQERALTDFYIKKEKLNNLNSEIKKLRDTIEALMHLGVVTVDHYRAITEAYVNAKEPKIQKKFQQKMEMTDQYGPKLKYFQIRMENLGRRLISMETSYEQAETDANSFLSHKFTVEKAYPAEKKSYPIRWLIVLMSTTSVMLLTILGLIIRQRIFEFKS